MYEFVLFKFVKPYIQSVLFKTGSLHNTIWVFTGLLAVILVYHSVILPCSTNRDLGYFGYHKN